MSGRKTTGKQGVIRRAGLVFLATTGFFMLCNMPIIGAAFVGAIVSGLTYHMLTL